jgi:YfiH family protein
METIISKGISDEGKVSSAASSVGTRHSSPTDEQILTESGFYWREKNGVRVLVCRALEDAGFTNGFSTRPGGVSPFPKDDLNLAGFDEDSSENIFENRRRFLNVFDGDFVLSTVWQVHGEAIKVIKTDEDPKDTNQKFDGIVANIPNTLIGVKTADCVPVLLGDPKNKAFAAVHAGWRGTALSIVAKAIRLMHAEFGADPGDLICAIGPAAGCGNYEIGQDVIDTFVANLPESEKYFNATRPGHALIDLHSANRDQAIAAGILSENIYVAPFCTMERTDLFFSYRKERKTLGKTGRLLSIIGRK